MIVAWKYIFLYDLPLLVTVHNLYIGHICLHMIIFTVIIDLGLVIDLRCAKNNNNK